MFLWIRGSKQSMFGVWSTGLLSIGSKLHVVFKVSINDLLNTHSILRSKGITPLNIPGQETDKPTVISFIPSISVYFHDPDGHLLGYLALLDEESRPNLGMITWSQ